MLSRAISFLQKRFPSALVANNEWNFTHSVDENYKKKVWPLLAVDWKTGVKQGMIAVESLDNQEELNVILETYLAEFGAFSEATLITVSNASGSEQEINSQQMTFAARIVLYLGTTNLHRTQIIEVLESVGVLAEIVLEVDLFKTVFVSYGGPDEQVVTEINGALKNSGVKTWFFPDDALPGDKLHRMMTNGINKFDRVLLICSKDSLKRSGVLNEIERVLEREARDGGGDILIPVTLDDFVYSDWCPGREDVAHQIRSRVITKISNPDNSRFAVDIAKIVGALRLKQ